MTTKIGDTSFADLFASLRFQVEWLKRRCTSAEQEAASLRQQLQEQQAHIEELENANKEITEKYNGLQAGTATGASPEEIAKLRDRYLAMIREIVLCLSRLNG
jgi:cell division protein FtsB